MLGIRGRARYAQAHVPKRRRHHRVPRVLQCWLLRHEELAGFLGSAVDFFEEGQHYFHPYRYVSLWSYGPSMVAFLKEVYGRAKEADKFLMSQQPALKHSWNTMVASSFWDMRLSIACAATDAEHQNRIILQDNSSWRGSPIPTPTTRRSRRRAALAAPRGPGCSRDTRSSQLHAAACPACCTAP